MSTLHASCVALLTYFTVWNRYHALDANMVRNIVVCGQHGGLLPFLDNLDGADARPSWVMVANSTETRAVASAVGGGMSPPVGDIGGLDSGAFPPAPQGPAVHTTCSGGGGGGGGSGGRSAATAGGPRHLWFDSWSHWWHEGRCLGDALPLVLRSESESATGAGGPIEKFLADSLPYFFIIGSQKGGTTLLKRLLAQHPRLGTHRGEGRYWGWPRLSPLRNTPDAYAQKFVSVVQAASAADRQHLYPIFFDHTPNYLVSPFAPAQLSHLLPRSARFILQLRRPADRFLSNLKMELCRSDAEDRSALAAEMQGLGFGDLLQEEVAAAAVDVEGGAGVGVGVGGVGGVGGGGGVGAALLRRYLESSEKQSWKVSFMEACNASASIELARKGTGGRREDGGGGGSSSSSGFPFFQRLWHCRMLVDHQAPLARGLYASHVESWFHFFAAPGTGLHLGRSSLEERQRVFHISNAETFFRDPRRAVEAIVNFLGLQRHAFEVTPEIIAAQKDPVFGRPSEGGSAHGSAPGPGPWCVDHGARDDDHVNDDVNGGDGGDNDATRRVRDRFRELSGGAAAEALSAFYDEDTSRLSALLGSDFDWRPW